MVELPPKPGSARRCVAGETYARLLQRYHDSKAEDPQSIACDPNHWTAFRGIRLDNRRGTRYTSGDEWGALERTLPGLNRAHTDDDPSAASPKPAGLVVVADKGSVRRLSRCDARIASLNPGRGHPSRCPRPFNSGPWTSRRGAAAFSAFAPRAGEGDIGAGCWVLGAGCWPTGRSVSINPHPLTIAHQPFSDVLE
jgi:hypothetical protein